MPPPPLKPATQTRHLEEKIATVCSNLLENIVCVCELIYCEGMGGVVVMLSRDLPFLGNVGSEKSPNGWVCVKDRPFIWPSGTSWAEVQPGC